LENKKGSSWPWDEALDAMKAAPEHHTLLFENDAVRVLDTCIPPGGVTNIHTHQWAASLYILSWSDFIRYDREGNVLLDSRNIVQPPSSCSAIWGEPLVPHRVKNIGDRDLHVISTEIKNR
jgi:hypothetical protein